MSNVKWIKIVTDIFDDEKILLIESMPNSDSMIVIWFKLLCLAGKINNGGVLILNDQLPYTDHMIATIFRRDIESVKFALKTFESLGMILTVNDTITIPNWSKHQTLDQLEKRTKYMKEYMKKYREEQANRTIGKKEEDLNKLSNPNINIISYDDSCKTNSGTNCKANSRPKSKPNHKPKVNTLDIELEREEERDKDIYKTVVGYLNKKTGKNYKSTTKSTQRFINARLQEGFKLDDFQAVIDNKVSSWKGNTNMEPFLRPNTLFGPKFESYLNENIQNKNTKEFGW